MAVMIGLAGFLITGYALWGLTCASSTCVAVGDSGTIEASGDGGKTWQDVSPGTSSPLLGIACPSSRTCLAVGVAGIIAASGDGGKTWHGRP